MAGKRHQETRGTKSAAGLSTAVVSRIRDDRRHGASQLAQLALEGLLNAIEEGAGLDPIRQRELLLELVAALKQVRPSMQVIANVLRIWEARFELHYRRDPDHGIDLGEEWAVMTRDLMNQLSQASSDSARHMAEMVGPGEVIMTHSLSSAVKQFFSWVKTKGVTAIVTESRPLQEGILLAQYLSDLHIDTTLITDAQMGVWCKRATRIISGADCVLNDGTVVNKAGTFLLALTAREYGVPFYVCCESFKLVKQTPDELQLEEMQASELGVSSIPLVESRNVYFDLTPAKLVTGWVTESGVRQQW